MIFHTPSWVLGLVFGYILAVVMRKLYDDVHKEEAVKKTNPKRVSFETSWGRVSFFDKGRLVKKLR